MFDLSQINKQELYRLIVDGRFHSSEKGFLGYLKREFGCLPAAFDALEYALTNLSDKSISPQLIIDIHQRATTNVKNLIGSDLCYRNKLTKFSLLLDDNFDEQGARIAHMRYSAFGAMLGTQGDDYRYSIDDLKELFDFVRTHERRILKYKAPSDFGCIESIMVFICESYNNAIMLASSDDDKLKIIASHLQYLDQLHPFSDGNIRTCYILLQRMLIQQGFYPCMMNNPNIFDACSLENIVIAIKEGMNNTRLLINNPAEPIYDYVTEKIDENEIECEKTRCEIKKYYDSAGKLHTFLSTLPRFPQEDNHVVEKKNKALLSAILSWVRQVIFEQTVPVPPVREPSIKKLDTLRRLLEVHDFFNKDLIDNGIELDDLLSECGLAILTRHLDMIEQEIDRKIQPFIDSGQLIEDLQQAKDFSYKQAVNKWLETSSYIWASESPTFTFFALKITYFLEQVTKLFGKSLEEDESSIKTSSSSMMN